MLKKFQSYQSRQINSDLISECQSILGSVVSIVSIQTDQSRHCSRLVGWARPKRVSIVSIQTDQSRRDESWGFDCYYFWFQSYQSKQINPDLAITPADISAVPNCFNRINPDRSIPTLTGLPLWNGLTTGFNRINPDRSIPTTVKLRWSLKLPRVSIVSIQTDQSRQLPLRSQSWRGSQMPNGGTYFWKTKMIKIYTTNFVYNLINKFSIF